MKQISPLIILCLLLSSCATVFNSSQTTVSVHTSEPSKIIVNTDTIETQKNKAKILLQRSANPVEITVQTDSLDKKIVLQPKNSAAYWLNLLYTSVVGMWIERNEPKRYTYQKFVYLNPSDTLRHYSKFRLNYHKGETYIHLSLPHINQYYFVPPEEVRPKRSFGYWGLSAGIDHYHSQNQYINLSGSATANIFIPFPAPIDIDGEYEAISSLFCSLSNNHKINRFSLGYGITYTENIWDLRYSNRFGSAPPPTREPVRKKTENLGLIFSTYYQTGSHFQIGLIYRPTFIRLKPIEAPSRYEHLISVDFAWKIDLND